MSVAHITNVFVDKIRGMRWFSVSILRRKNDVLGFTLFEPKTEQFFLSFPEISLYNLLS